MYGYVSTKMRSIRAPLFVGFVLLTGGILGLATVQPGQSANPVAFCGLAGIGFGGPLVLIVAGVHLSTPHHLIATATAVTTSARAVAATVFTAIYAAALSDRIARLLPKYVAEAAVGAGLPTSSLSTFVAAFAEGDENALATISGVTPGVLSASATALKQAQADSIRVVYIIAAPFGALACVACFFLGDLSKVMNYRVDAPVEDLHAKGSRHQGSGDAKI